MTIAADADADEYSQMRNTMRINFIPRIASLTFCLVTAITLAGQSTQPASQTTGTPTDPSRQVLKLERAIPCSVAEAWDLGGKTEEGFLEIVKMLAALSAQKRGLTLPETKETGARAGETINKMAKADPDQLLYVIVDKAVQQVGIRTAAK